MPDVFLAIADNEKKRQRFIKCQENFRVAAASQLQAVHCGYELLVPRMQIPGSRGE